jgi:type I restriction enzyme S subunit
VTIAHSTVGDVLLDIETGKSVKTKERPAQSGETGILKVSAVTWGEFRPKENKAVLDDYDPGDCPRVEDGDLLISRANTRDLVGAPVLVSGHHSNLLLSDKILRLVSDDARIEKRYLARALRSAASRRHFESRAGGTSGSMTNITQEDIRSAPLPLPPLDEQRRIADILDKADAIRRKRKETITLTDNLLRSTFLEMFGDPVSNPKKWPITFLGDEAVQMKYGTSEKCGSELQNALPVLRIPNVVRGEIDWSALKFGNLSPKEADGLRLRNGDLLVVRTNGNPDYIGRCAVYVSERIALFASYLIRVRLGEDRLHPIYVQAALSSASYRAQLTAEARTTAGNYNISTEGLRRLRLPVPPLAMQQRFTDVCTKIRRSQKQYRLAERNAEALVGALGQRAFGTSDGLPC